MPSHSELIRARCPNDGDQILAAVRIGVSAAFFNQWATGRRQVPMKKGPAVERALGIPRWEMWPADWHEMWPELIGTPGAPAVEAAAPVRG